MEDGGGRGVGRMSKERWKSEQLETCAGGMKEGCVDVVCRRGVREGCGGVHITIPWS